VYAAYCAMNAQSLALQAFVKLVYPLKMLKMQDLAGGSAQAHGLSLVKSEPSRFGCCSLSMCPMGAIPSAIASYSAAPLSSSLPLKILTAD